MSDGDPSLEQFTQREVGTRFELGKLGFAAFSPDGRTVLVAQHTGDPRQRTVFAWNLDTGVPRRLAIVPGQVTALGAPDLGGKRLFVGYVAVEKSKQVPSVASIDLETGEVGPRVGRGHKWLRGIATSSDGKVVFSAENDRVRAYSVDASGAASEDRSIWSVAGAKVSLAASGAAVVLRGRSLDLHDALSKEPRVSIATDVPAEALARFHIEATGSRVVIVAEDVILLESDGSVIARAPLPAPNVLDAIASPSGHHVAIVYAEGGERTTVLDLLDLRAGKARRFDLGARPRSPAWSPSGRRLALPTDQGTVVLLEVPDARTPVAAPGPAPASTSPEEPWIELRAAGRFWRGRQRGGLIEYHSGAVGTRGRFGATPCDDAAAAERELARRVRAKEAEGFTRHPGP